MNDVRKIDLRKAGAWLSDTVDIRVPRGWLVIGAAVVVALLLLALD
jgi:hypothetical protein